MSVHEVIRRLPGIDVLRDRCRALAMLEAVLSREREYRYYSHNSAWSPTEELASMRNGSGDDYAIVFGAAGAYAKGFDHESPMSPYDQDDHEPWPGLFDSVPEVFRSCVDEPAFRDETGVPEATVCFWRERADSAWRTGEVQPPERERDDVDGARWLFRLLVDGRPESYADFAADYYERRIDLDAVRHVFELRPLTAEVVAALNPEVGLSELAADLAEIGYPAAGKTVSGPTAAVPG